MVDVPRTPGEVVRSFVAAWNANDLDAVVAHLHVDVFYHNVPLEPISGRDAVRRYLSGKGGFDWVDWKMLALAESGNKVLTERVDDFGIGGRTVSLPIMGIFEIEDGLIRAWRDYFDLATYRRQLGQVSGLPGQGSSRMDLGLAGKVALVTAASQGIGRATALALAREGARVAICARDLESLERAAAEVTDAGGQACEAIRCDLADAAQVEAMVARVVDRLGTVHVLVNNAGGPPPGDSARLTDADWQRAFEITLMSAVRTTRAVLPHMRRQRWGRIINVSSYSVKQPIPDLLLSNSIRLAVAGWAKTVAAEAAPDNVLVNTVAPGWTRTGRVAQMLSARAGPAASGAGTPEDVEARIVSSVPLRRMADPREIADVVVFLASERASYVTGTLLPVDGGAVQAAV